MKSDIQEGWSFATDDGRFTVSGVGRIVEHVTIEAVTGSGMGKMEEPGQRVTLTIPALTWNEIARAVGERTGGRVTR